MKLNEVYAVVVLYKTSLEESKTIKTLNEALNCTINLFVFDNSPYRQYEERFTYGKFKIFYISETSNPGLSYAYNYALDEANKLNLKWLLLLDQDTTLTEEYIHEIGRLEIDQLSQDVVAFIPRVMSLGEKKMISPANMLIGGLCQVAEMKTGIIANRISAINSGTILKVSYLNTIDGFCEKYTLDMLDHWCFRKIFRDNKMVFLMNSRIYQDLSIYGVFEQEVSFIRYKQMLESEYLFIEDDGYLSLFVFKLRLCYRVFKQIKFSNKDYYKLTLKHVFR